MKIANISETKNKLSVLLEHVRKGESILILDRKVPIARIVPLDSSYDVSDPLSMLEQNVPLRRASKKLTKDFFETPLPRTRNKASAVDVLIAERSEGR